MKAIQITWIMILFAIGSFAQPLTGIKTIPGDYATIAAAISALNSNGTSAPGVTFNIASAYTENENTSTYQWIINTTTSGESAPVVFQKVPGGNTNPKIFIVGGSASTDCGFIVAGTDYITFDGIDITATNNLVEWGFGFVKKSSVAPFDGCQHVIVRNCTINLERTNTYNTYGIYSGNHTSTSLTSLNLTTPSDVSSDFQFYNNSISDVSCGLMINGYNAPAPYTLYNQNIEIGLSGANLISDYGSGSTPSGVYVSYSNNVTISNNSIISATLAAGGSSLSGIYLGVAVQANGTVYNNDISLSYGGTYTGLYGIYSEFGGSGLSNTLNINNNTIHNCAYPAASSGNFYGIYNYLGNGPGTINILNNSIHDITVPGSGKLSGIDSGSATNININDNVVYNLTKTAYANLNGIQARTGILVMHDNLVHDLTITTGYGDLYGIVDNSSPTNENYYNNTVYNLTHGGNGAVCGIFLNTTSGIRNAYLNTVHALSSVGGTVTGMYHALSTPSIYKNNIYDLTSTTSSGNVNGITIDGGNSIYLYNNFISDLKTPAATGTNAIRGIYKNAGSALYCYNNTIYINASSSSTTTFGTSGIYADTYWNIELKNNVIVNTSTPVYTTAPAYTVAYRRSSTSIGTYSSSSNNNCFYTGTPSANNLIYHDGTNSDQSVVLFKIRVSPRETNSFTENPAFIDVAAHNLHINNSIPTTIESGGQRITTPVAVGTDYDGEIRWGESGYSGTGTSVDVGADEANFTPHPAMSYQSSTTLQQTGYVFSGNTNQKIIAIRITVDGNPSPLTLTQLTFNANGTSDINDINTTPAKVYFTGNAPNFVPGILFGSNTPTIANFIVNGSQSLTYGENYFWLVYDVKQTAPTDHLIDAECVSMMIGGISRVPTMTAPSGSRTILGPMSGTYLVGVANSFPNFSTLTEAVNNINNRGAGGPVTFLLTNSLLVPYSSSYGETLPITVNEIPLTSATNTVTLKPNVGVSCIINGNSATSVFYLNGTDYFIIDGSNNGTLSKDLTIENISTGNWTAALQVSNGVSGLGAKNVTIKNCRIYGGSPGNNGSATYAFSAGSTIGATGADNDNMTIDNNEFSRAFYGLFIGGTPGGVMDNLLFTNNVIGSIDANYYCGNVGLNLNNVNGTVSQNVINGVVSSVISTYGIYVGAGTRNMTISRNDIHSVKGVVGSTMCGTGMAIDLASAGYNVTVCNNIFYDITGDGSSNLSSYGTAGIKVYGISTNVKVYHNTISLSGLLNHVTTNDLSTAIYVGASVSQIDIRNNILSNSLENLTGDSKAYSIYVAGSASVFNNLDYNDYFTSGLEGVLGYFGSDRTTIESWRSATGKDLNSVSSSPNLNTLPSLVPFEVSSVLDVCPSVSIADDFSGFARTVPVSMGAYESGGDLSAPLITYSELDNTHLLNARTLTVTITDTYGSIPHTGNGLPQLYWKINSNPYSVVAGIWISDNNYQFTFGEGVSMGNTVSYFVVAQDNESTPNVGCFPSTGASGLTANPPACFFTPTSPTTYTIVPGLSGTKNIPGDYASLTGVGGLFADINSKVLTGNLIVNIVGNLTENGANALNEINIEDPAYSLSILGTGTQVTISGSYSGALIRFNGADNVRVNGNDKILISNTTASGSTVLSLTNNCNNNIIEHCAFSTGASHYPNNSAITINGTSSNNIIRYDSISKCYYGVLLDGTYWNQASGNSVYGNHIGSNTVSSYVYQYGVYAKYQNNLLIQDNTIYNMIDNNSPQAIYLEGVTNSVIEKNFIHDIVYNGASYGGASGITNKSINANPNIVISNNVIRKISGMGSSPNTGDNNTIPAGIKLFGTATSGIKVYFNSIYMTPDPINGLFTNNEWCAAVEIGAGVSGIQFSNNIIQNSVGERSSVSVTSYGYAIYCKSAASPFASINNNVYYTTNFDNNFVGLAGTASPPVNNLNLAAWRIFTGQDAQSLNANPLYTSTGNLTLQVGSPALSAGTAISGISTDYTNAFRNPTAPSIGAYEGGSGIPGIDWANLQYPSIATITQGGSVSVYAQVYEAGLTSSPGQGAGIEVWIGWNSANTDPASWTNWTIATYSGDVSSNDEYMANVGDGINAGTYFYASRIKISGGNYQYGGYRIGNGGFWDGLVFNSGTLIVNAPVTNKSINVTVFLEGAYDTGGAMLTTLFDNTLVPLAQPYNAAPWNYTGLESVVAVPAGVVDWVLVDLRDAATPETATNSITGWPKAYFLKSNGSIVDLDGTTLPNIGNPVIAGNLYVVVRHRNHIAVMSSAGMELDIPSNTYAYNFSAAIDQAFGAGAGYKEIEAGVFGMVAGDADADGDIAVNDYTLWAIDFGNAPVYFNTDIDMDSDLGVNDYTTWAINFGIANPIASPWRVSFRSQVPNRKQ